MEIRESKLFLFDGPTELNLKNILKITYAGLTYPLWKLRLNLFAPHKFQIEKKYNVCICAIFRNEAPYLKEWIEYHQIIGVEHFYLYNNFSEDQYKQVLAPYIENGLVTLIEWPFDHSQMAAYENCVNRFSDETKWIGFIDLDEYVVPNDMDTIYDFLRPFEPNRAAVIIYWKFFGSAGKIEREKESLIIEDFIVSFRKYSQIGKLFFNTAYEYDANNKLNSTMHVHWSKYKNHVIPPVNEFDKIPFWFIHRAHRSADPTHFPIQINHYITKSYREFCEKGKRGSAFAKSHVKDDAYFFAHENQAQSTDYHIFKYIVRLKRALGLD